VGEGLAASRGGWAVQWDFFMAHGFSRARDIVNFTIDLADMPTPAAIATSNFAAVTPADVPAILALAPMALRSRTAEEFERHLLRNAYFGPESVYVLRNRASEAVAAGVLIHKDDYANPRLIDAGMPCFRLGAFGTEGMSVKRVDGLFSFLTRAGADTNALALTLMSEADRKSTRLNSS